MNINKRRPIQPLVGNNRGIVRQRLGQVHLSNSVFVAAREARPNNMRNMPVELRRGWALCVLETWNEYQSTYYAVITGNLGGAE